MTKGRAHALPFLVGGWFWMVSLAIEANEDIAIISRRRVILKLYINGNSIYNVGRFKVFEITC